MDHLYSLAFVGLITVGTVYRKRIIKFVLEVIETRPGISSLHKERGRYYVKTDLGKVKLNYIPVPNHDTEVYLFSKGHDFTDVNENMLISNKDFLNRFSEEKAIQLFKYNGGIIPDVYYPHDFKKKTKIVGFIEDNLESKIYIFVVNENRIIDYRNIFEDYTLALNEFKFDELD